MIIFMLLFAFMGGCSKNLDFATDEPFIVVSSSIAGPDIARNFYPTNISLYDNGKLVLHTETTEKIVIGEDAPIVKMQLEENEVDNVKRLIKKNEFWKFKEDVSDDDSVDGSFLYITVNLTDESKTVGGLNPDHPEFNDIADYVRKLVSDDDYRWWNKEIKEYIIETNPELE